MQRGDLMKLNFKGPEIQKCDIPTYRAQRVEEKNVIICLVIMFIPRVMVFKMSVILFCVFSADNSKKLVTVWARYLGVPGRS